jgi:hypothetical protein
MINLFRVPPNIQTWEAVATIQIVQQLPDYRVILTKDLPEEDIVKLFELAGVGYRIPEEDFDRAAGDRDCTLNLVKAYAATEKANCYYGQVLAQVNGLQVGPLAPPKFPFVIPGEKKGIVLCPFGLRQEFDIAVPIWKEVVRQLESYDQQVYLLGDRGQRMDEIAFTEPEILSDLPLIDKLQILSSAKVVIGVANAWTWLSSAWSIKRLLLHPEKIRNDRWYPALNNDETKFLLTDPEVMNVPIVLVGIRKLMREL